jgi:hypothetical protein
MYNNSSSFYVFLPSNTKVDGNRTNSFRVRLPQKLEFGAEWSVGLAVLIYPHTWLSLGTNNQQFLRIQWKTGDDLRIEISSSSIRSPRDLVAALNELLKENGRPDLAKRALSLEHVAIEARSRTLQLIAEQEEKRRQAIVSQRKAAQNISNILQGNDDDDEDADDDLEDNLTKQKMEDDIEIPPLPTDLYEHIFRHHYLQAIEELLPAGEERLFFSRLINRHIASGVKEQLVLQKWASIFTEPRSVCKFMFNDEQQRFSLSMDSNFIECIELSEQLAYIMGFTSPELRGNIEIAKFTPDMTGGVSSFNIYAPGLIEPVIIGDVTAPLLRMVSIRGRPDEIIEDTYVAIQYHRLLVKEVSEIFIEIRSASGSLMPFQYGTCTLTLHFRKIPYF